MKKVLSFLLALAFVMSLIQMQAAALQSGQTCPDCGEGMLIIIVTNSSQHAFSCSNTHCEHGSSSGYLWEDHHGGTACTAKPVCEECGKTYGSILGHDWLDANCTQPKRCSRGDAIEGEPLGHIGGAATCTAQAVCTRCQQPYGDPLGHTGGTATCTSQAVCTRCQQPYGDALGHDWETGWTNGGDTHYHACARCSERKDEAAHSYVWSYVDDNTCRGTCVCGAEITEAHYDRWASFCGRQPHCEKCNHDYGSVTEHEMYYEYKSETGHQPNCYHCDTYFFPEAHSGGNATCESAPICEKCGHEYGSALGHDWLDADCTQPKRCSRCDATEGEPLGHDWSDWLETTAPTCTEKGEKTRTCKRDGCTASEKEEIPPSGTGHKPGKAVKENEEIHCVSDSSYDEVVYCTVCKKELSRKHITYKSSHDYKPWEWHETITRMYFKCTKCGNFYWLHNPESWNMKPGLVRYASGDAVDYKAYATGPDDDGVLTVTPIKHTERDSTDDISLYMTPDDVYVWTWEKMNRIELVRNRVVLAIDPREITPEMFGLKENEKPDYYVFTLTPSGEDGWQVRAEVLLGEKRLSAQELKGITLTAAGKETVITANGVYKAE